MARALLVGLVLAAAVGCRDKGTTLPPAPDATHSAVGQIDEASLARELADNRPSALNRHLGEQVEVDAEYVSIEGGTESMIRLFIVPVGKWEPAKRFGIGIEGKFSFSDPRNSSLKSVKKGPFKATMRGYISAIDSGPDNLHTVILSPAWIERLP